MDHQKPDFFYFISLLKKGGIFTEGFLLGAINTSNLLTKGDFWGAGEIDARNGKRIRVDCISIEIKDLISNDDFITRLTEINAWNR